MPTSFYHHRKAYYLILDLDSFIQHISEFNSLHEYSKIENAEKSNLQICFKFCLKNYTSTKFCKNFKVLTSCHIVQKNEGLKVLKF